MKNQTEIEGLLLLSQYGYCWDGGSILLVGKDEPGRKIEIELIQREFLEDYKETRIPGRLYINQTLVEIRSEMELLIIQKLKNAQINADFIHPPEWLKTKSSLVKNIAKKILVNKTYGKKSIAAWVNKIVAFVESDEYLKLSKKIKTP